MTPFAVNLLPAGCHFSAGIKIIVPVAKFLPADLHRSVSIEVIPLAVDLLPVFEHGAARAEEVPVSVNLLPFGHHFSAGIEIIAMAVQILPADMHRSVFIEVIPLAVDLLPVFLHYAVSIKIIPTAVNLLPTGYRLSFAAIIILVGTLFYPACINGCVSRSVLLGVLYIHNYFRLYNCSDLGVCNTFCRIFNVFSCRLCRCVLFLRFSNYLCFLACGGSLVSSCLILSFFRRNNSFFLNRNALTGNLFRSCLCHDFCGCSSSCLCCACTGDRNRSKRKR